jgi:hypothetical protein
MMVYEHVHSRPHTTGTEKGCESIVLVTGWLYRRDVRPV